MTMLWKLLTVNSKDSLSSQVEEELQAAVGGAEAVSPAAMRQFT